jgi:hypothetical protein
VAARAATRPAAIAIRTVRLGPGAGDPGGSEGEGMVIPATQKGKGTSGFRSRMTELLWK